MKRFVFQIFRNFSSKPHISAKKHIVAALQLCSKDNPEKNFQTIKSLVFSHIL